MDYVLPGTDGIELGQKLRADRATARIPVVVLAASRIPAYMGKQPWKALIMKPVSVESLLQVLDAALAGPVGADMDELRARTRPNRLEP